MSRARLCVALLLVVVTLAAWAPATAAGTTARSVADAALRWGISNEVNNAAFAPGTMNFLGAGRMPNPGTGGHRFTEDEWRQEAGDTGVEKVQPGGGYAPATWEGLRTDVAGDPITSPTSGRFSGHQVVLSDGTGWVDPETGRASLSWDAEFTVVLYSGYSFFYVADPELAVARDGTGTLSGTVSGYAASRDDPDVWQRLKATRVTLATLEDVEVTASGLVVTPSYAGVRYASDDPAAPAQVRRGSGWGSWPASFVDFQVRTGQSSYWYSSGGSTDAFKAPLPVGVGYTPGALLDEDPEDPADPDPDDSAAFTVSDAQLRWGVNNESNNSAFAPGTANFFSAGKVPDPGSGGRLLAKADWRARAGDVRVEKRRPDGDFARATWAGLTTTADGTPLGSPTNGLFSDHQVVLDGGTGSVDPDAGTATIRWKGSFTVLYYSGMTFFYVSDPVLEVSPGSSRVTAVLSGFGSDRDDTSTWFEVTQKRVTLADLPDLTPKRGKGITATPRYDGVAYAAPSGEPAQVRGDHFGAFPVSFLRYLTKVGSASYWYSSGGSTDAFKEPLPLSVSYDADDPVDVPDTTDPDVDPSTTTSVDPPDAVRPPGATAGGSGSTGSRAVSTSTVAAATALLAPYAPPTLYGREAAPDLVAADVTATTPADWRWWLGGGLLLGSALLLLSPLTRKVHR